MLYCLGPWLDNFAIIYIQLGWYNKHTSQCADDIMQLYLSVTPAPKETVTILNWCLEKITE